MRDGGGAYDAGHNARRGPRARIRTVGRAGLNIDLREALRWPLPINVRVPEGHTATNGWSGVASSVIFR